MRGCLVKEVPSNRRFTIESRSPCSSRARMALSCSRAHASHRAWSACRSSAGARSARCRMAWAMANGVHSLPAASKPSAAQRKRPPATANRAGGLRMRSCEFTPSEREAGDQGSRARLQVGRVAGGVEAARRKECADDSKTAGQDALPVPLYRILRIHRAGKVHDRPVEYVDELGPDVQVVSAILAETEVPADVGVLGRNPRAAEILVVHRSRREAERAEIGRRAGGIGVARLPCLWIEHLRVIRAVR